MSCEAMGQSMTDLHSCLLLLDSLGAGETGLIGASLGGYNASLYSCLSDRHSFAAMMVPAINFSKPYGPAFAKLPFTVDPSFMEKITKVWELPSPLNHTPKLSTDRMLFVASRGDRLCPFEYLEQLREKWQFSRFRYMTGGHWLIFNGKQRGKAWYNFLSDMGFGPVRQ
jgi:pimeloyl-ACP methyl ester carboxylesterase